jgi:hypothetical protein
MKLLKSPKTIKTGQKEIMKYLCKSTQNDSKPTFWFFFNSNFSKE